MTLPPTKTFVYNNIWIPHATPTQICIEDYIFVLHLETEDPSGDDYVLTVIKNSTLQKISYMYVEHGTQIDLGYSKERFPGIYCISKDGKRELVFHITRKMLPR